MDPLPSSSSYPHSYLPPYPFQEHPFYLPIILYLYTSSTNSLSHPNVPIHIVYWACPPTPFSLFWTVFSHLPAISTLPHHFISIAIVYQGSPFTSWPIPFPCPCLPPCPHFRFFGRFLDALLHVFLSHFVYTCKYMIISIE